MAFLYLFQIANFIIPKNIIRYLENISLPTRVVSTGPFVYLIFADTTGTWCNFYVQTYKINSGKL